MYTRAANQYLFSEERQYLEIHDSISVESYLGGAPWIQTQFHLQISAGHRDRYSRQPHLQLSSERILDSGFTFSLKRLVFVRL